jgi:hypothetical protein
MHSESSIFLMLVSLYCFCYVQFMHAHWLLHFVCMESYIRMGKKAIWEKTNVKYFCDLCKIGVLAGHMPLGHLNKVVWKNIES